MQQQDGDLGSIVRGESQQPLLWGAGVVPGQAVMQTTRSEKRRRLLLVLLIQPYL